MGFRVNETTIHLFPDLLSTVSYSAWLVNHTIVNFIIRETNGEKHFDQDRDRTRSIGEAEEGLVEMFFAVRLTKYEIYYNSFILTAGFQASPFPRALPCLCLATSL